MAAQVSGGNGRDPAAATTAMWPAVLHGERPRVRGRRAATRRIDRCNNAVALAEAKVIGQAADHRQVADKMRQRVDAEGRHGSCPNEDGVSCKERDR